MVKSPPPPKKLEQFEYFKPLAMRLALSYIKRLPRSVQPDDIKQAALIGLHDWLMRHPYEAGGQYINGMKQRIKGAIIDELRAQDWLPRARSRNRPERFMVGIGDARDAVAIETALISPQDSPEEQTIRKIDGAKVWKAPMPPRVRRIAQQRFLGGKSHLEIAAVEKVSEPRISQLQHKAVLAMRSFLGLGQSPVSPVSPRKPRRVMEAIILSWLCRRFFRLTPRKTLP